MRISVPDHRDARLTEAEEPSRRPSKREHDVADVLALLEQHRELRSRELMASVSPSDIVHIAAQRNAGIP